MAVPAYRPLSLAWHRARQTQASARSTARAGFGRPKSSKFYAQTCAEAGDESRPAPTCNATALYIPLAREGEGLQECRRRAASGPTARARESAGGMENAPPCRWDPRTSPAHGTGADCNWRWEGPSLLSRISPEGGHMFTRRTGSLRSGSGRAATSAHRARQPAWVRTHPGCHSAVVLRYARISSAVCALQPPLAGPVINPPPAPDSSKRQPSVHGQQWRRRRSG